MNPTAMPTRSGAPLLVAPVFFPRPGTLLL
jgi:hypothetical protein